MKYASKYAQIAALKTPCLVIGIYEGRRTDNTFDTLDEASEGRLRRILRKGDLKGSTGDSQMLYELPGIAAGRVLLLGLGKKKDLDAA